MSSTTFDLNLARKYNVPGPRYTSYPTAPNFSDQVQWSTIAEKIRQSENRSRPLSLYFHIPFCESLCWYCGCTTVITNQHNIGATYIKYVEKEMDQICAHLGPDRVVTQLHWGGGTPTFLRPEEIRQLAAAIRRRFILAPDIEASAEIDPRRLTPDHVQALAESGFNRASIGVQDFDPDVQRAIHRVQSFEQTEAVVDLLRHAGFISVNLDLIYGLPRQSAESFSLTLDQVLKLAPDRLAVFSYAHVPWIKPVQKILEANNALPSADDKLLLLKTAIEKLTSNNRFLYIGMDHFARPNDELALAQQRGTLQRDFQGYSARAGADIFAFGMSAISQAADAYWQNRKDLTQYYALLDAGRAPFSKGCVLTPDDRIRRHVIMRIMCDLRLDYKELSTKLGIDFPSAFAAELDSLAELQNDGLVIRRDDALQVTDLGRLFLRNIAMRFDRYLNAKPSPEMRFSRTI
jgi:oxygen-independent coproporphyrinogen-3 oxidase